MDYRTGPVPWAHFTLHPQTLLCYEMDGRPLTTDHGAPLRLVIPVKYGIKSLKQVGTPPVRRPSSRRLLGRAGLRLVRRPLSRTAPAVTRPRT
jgi:DMSO/TMAO reductase YedYZ molybdopterin-dependent catalytic subunit